MKKVLVHYFALLREERGKPTEWVKTEAVTLEELYEQLQNKHHFSLAPKQLKVALNADFASMKSTFEDKDLVAFIPPVAGG
jgi:molybdopterin converting factor subunit 1